jgi:hypothetical protein
MNTKATVRQRNDERATLLSKLYGQTITERQLYYKGLQINKARCLFII